MNYISKKYWPIIYSKVLYKLGLDFLDIQYRSYVERYWKKMLRGFSFFSFTDIVYLERQCDSRENFFFVLLSFLNRKAVSIIHCVRPQIRLSKSRLFKMFVYVFDTFYLLKCRFFIIKHFDSTLKMLGKTLCLPDNVFFSLSTSKVSKEGPGGNQR